MHKPSYILVNDTHKLLLDFGIKTDHLITARRPEKIIINKRKRTCKIVDFAIPADLRVKLKESEKKNNYLGLTRDLKKLWNRKVTFIPTVIGALCKITKKIIKGLEVLNLKDEYDHPNYCITEISQNTEKTCGGLMSLKLQGKTIS